MRLERFEPRWFAATAGLAIGGLVLLSVAAGTVSVAPPPAPTPLPGQPTPTAGPPSLRVGNLVIQAPPAPRPTASPTEAVAVAVAGETVVREADPTPVEAEPATPQNADSGGFRLSLPFFQAPPRPTAVPRPVAQPTAVPDAPLVMAPDDAPPAVIPVASPAARISGPRRGSALDDALRTASIANDEFNRGLHEPVPNGSQP